MAPWSRQKADQSNWSRDKSHGLTPEEAEAIRHRVECFGFVGFHPSTNARHMGYLGFLPSWAKQMWGKKRTTTATWLRNKGGV